MKNKRPLEIKIVCGFFLFFGFVNLIAMVLQQKMTIIPILFIVTAIGIYLSKGWAYNFALFLNLFNFYYALVDFLKYFAHSISGSIAKGLLNLLIGLLIYILLLKKKIRILFPRHPFSLFFIGLLLQLVFLKNTGIAIVDYLRMIVSIVGFAIILYAIKQYRESNIISK